MIDNQFRFLFSKYSLPLIKGLYWFRLTPNQITYLGFLTAVLSAYCVVQGQYILAIFIWWLSRLLDACDGIYARHFGMTTKWGAFLDIQLDMLAYSVMILGFYWQFPELSLQWVIILISYVLCISGALSLGNFESELGIADNSRRGLRLAVGLAEAGETGIFYTLFLLFPKYLPILTWIWIFVLSLTVFSRFVLARSILGDTK